MPSVKTQTSLKAVAEPKAIVVDKITQADLLAFVPLFTEYVTATKALNKLKKKFDAATVALLLTSTGLNELDEVKKMTPDALSALVTNRLETGTFVFEEGEYDYTIAPSEENGRQTVAWKEVVLGLKGEAYVLDLVEKAPKTFSYKVLPIEGDELIDVE